MTDNVCFGRNLLGRLTDLGICPPETRRVVIDVPYDDVVTIYVEHLHAAPLLQLQADDLKGVVIKVAGEVQS